MAWPSISLPQVRQWSFASCAPAVLLTPCGVLRLEAGHGLVRDELRPGVVESAGLGAVLGELDHGLHALLGHLRRELQHRFADLSGLHVRDARATSIDRSDGDLGGAVG